MIEEEVEEEEEIPGVLGELSAVWVRPKQSSKGRGGSGWMLSCI
jgi:hypothetical protein